MAAYKLDLQNINVKKKTHTKNSPSHAASHLDKAYDSNSDVEQIDEGEELSLSQRWWH